MEPMSNLCVKVVRARKLAATYESIAPYVKIAVGNVFAKTQVIPGVIPNNLNPEWNRVLAFSEDKLTSKFIEISVWDADTVGANDFLGALSFLVEDIPSKEPAESPLAPSWYKLEERPGKTRVKGELLLALWMGNWPNVEEAWQIDTVEHAPFHSKMYLEPKLWYLRVHVIEAQDLLYPDLDPDKDPPGDRELFLDLNLGPVQTKRVRNPAAKGTNPVWNEDMLFVAAEPFEELLVVTVIHSVGPNKVEVIWVARIFIGDILERMDSRQEMGSAWFVMNKIEANGESDLGEFHFGRIHSTRLESGEVGGEFQGQIHLRLERPRERHHVFDEPPDFNSCTRPTAKQLWRAPLGVLELGIIGARNLVPMHIGARNHEGTSAYCVAKYGQKWVRTRTIAENFNPHWNEQHAWDVYNPSTVLTVAIFDNRDLLLARRGKDTPIGKARIRLSSLKNGQLYTNFYPLLAVTASGIKKMGELECSIRFLYSSTVKLEDQPPLPEMRYNSAPIDSSDLEDLRVAAMNLVASRLARFVPPLRLEVVQFMLDSTDNPGV